MKPNAIHIYLTSLAVMISSALADEAKPADYEIHEWGTFTSMHDSNGMMQRWYSPTPVKELPHFVYTHAKDGKVLKPPVFNPMFMKGGPIDPRLQFPQPPVDYSLRMETPVVYFHSKEKRTVSLMAAYSSGIVTEWYPRATDYSTDNNQAFILWDNILVDPTLADSEFPAATKEGAHYFAARATSGTPVKVSAPTAANVGHTETEKFLFYRGALNSSPPLYFQNVDGKGLGIRCYQPITYFALVVAGDGSLAWEKSRASPPVKPVDQEKIEPLVWPSKFASAAESRPKLETELVQTLTAAGLYEDEAKAMVDTWKEDWLGDPGKRLLCLVPQAIVDNLLPLTAVPKPRAIKRVFVSRMECFDNAMEEKIADIIASAPKDKDGARVGLQKLRLGRFQPQLLKLAEQHLAARSAQAIIELNRPSQPVSAR